MTAFSRALETLKSFTKGSIESTVSDDLKRLNKIEQGLGDKAIAYVLNGQHETCLATIHTKATAESLEVLWNVYNIQASTNRRRVILLNFKPEDLDFVKRYVDVLLAAAGDNLEYAPGSDAVPAIARVLYGEYFLKISAGKDTPNGSTPFKADEVFRLETLLQIGTQLGCSKIDMIDLFYTQRNDWHAVSPEAWRKIVDLQPLLANTTDDLIVAASRMPSTGREALMGDLACMQLTSTTSILGFLLEQSGDSAKGARHAAVNALKSAPAEKLEPLAIARLSTGKVGVRAAMVELLAGIGTPSALDALSKHVRTEKTARIVSAIDNALAVDEIRQGDPGADDKGYIAIGGARIEIPDLSPLDYTPAPVFDDSDVVKLRALINAANVKVKAHKKLLGKYSYLEAINTSFARELVDYFNSPSTEWKSKKVTIHGLNRFLSSWVSEALTRMPDAAALNLCARLEPWELYCFAYPHQAHRSTTKRILEFLNSPNGDLRHLENLLIDSKAKITLGDYRDHTERAHRPGDTLKKWLIQNYSPPMDCLVELPQASVWPYLATHLDIFEEVLGLKSGERFNFDKVKTLTALQLLPAIPAHFLGPLLEIATGSTRTAQDQARELLVDVHEIDARLITLLDDTRQAIRAGTAEWLAARGNTAAVGPLESRLKKEKSELARAAILTALTKLGSDIITHIGPQALADEALKGLKSAKLDKLDWLQLDNLPKATYVEGEQVPDNVLCYWIHLAVKLKQPGGNTLFEIYLDRLAPASAETFSTWVLDSWINYDTVRPSDEQANEYAAAHAQDRHESYVQYDPEYTLEKAIAELKTEVKGQYYHSGAASKGLLALATKAPPELVADRVRSYLKKHGRRTSQASSLLELAAAISHPTTLQAIIAAATRLRQKGVQAFAEELVQKVAEQHDWTLDELGDRTVPSAGLEDDGTLMLPCGQDEKPYLARLDDTFKLIVLNPAGKKISSLPAGTDDATKASRKRLSAARKELKQVIALQSARLYEALCAERIWPIEDWKRDLAKHPLMGQLIQRVVWIGLDEQDEVQTSFRPTAEGDFTDTSDNPIDLTPFAAVRIAHAALLDEAQGAAWLTHFTDYEVPPLIAQFGKTLLKLDDTKEAQAATEILDRKGWLSDTFTVRGAAMQLGYERGQAMDSGCFFNYQKPFKSAGLIAVVDFTGSFLPEENIPASIINLHFEKSDYGNRTVPLGDVPPVLLSECWNDLHLIAAKATFDPDWEKKSAW